MQYETATERSRGSKKEMRKEQKLIRWHYDNRRDFYRDMMYKFNYITLIHTGIIIPGAWPKICNKYMISFTKRIFNQTSLYSQQYIHKQEKNHAKFQNPFSYGKLLITASKEKKLKVETSNFFSVHFRAILGQLPQREF